MMTIEATILTYHDHPVETGGAVTPDNLSGMTTVSDGCTVTRSL
jgi:hypothetical protein